MKDSYLNSLSPLQEINNQIAKDIIKQRDERLIEVLKENGYSFENRAELILFIKENCELGHF